MEKKAVTLTIVANMTSNYSEGLGNVSRIQTIYRYGEQYAIRSRESLKNAIMVQSGMYDKLETEVKSKNKVMQKKVGGDLNAINCRALEGGYMSTGTSTKKRKSKKDNNITEETDNADGITYVRKSSFYLTDAVSTESFINETRFHNNLYLATNYANANNLNVQKDAGEVGLMPYQYEYDKSLKVYSITIDLEKIGKDDNFKDKEEASPEEKFERVKLILEAVKNLSLVVKGNLDNAEPLFVIGGMSERKTHYFDNVVRIESRALVIGDALIEKKKEGFNCALLKGNILINEAEIVEKLEPVSSMKDFFNNLIEEVKKYYGA